MKIMTKSINKTARVGKTRGYTLIELLIVISILSIFLFIAVPRFSLRGGLETPAGFIRGLEKKLNYLIEKSVLEKKVYIFRLDGEEGVFSFIVSEEGNPEGKVNDRFLKPGSIPPELKLVKVEVVPGGTVIENKVSIPFAPTGIMFSFKLYFKTDERTWLLEGIRTINRVVWRRLSEEEELQAGI